MSSIAKKIKLFGKKITQKEFTKVVKKLNIKPREAKKLKEGKEVNRYIYDIKKKNIGKIDLREKPLLLRKFGIKKNDPQQYFKPIGRIDNKFIIKKIHKGIDIKVTSRIKIQFELSAIPYTRHITRTITSTTEGLHEEVRNKVLEYGKPIPTDKFYFFYKVKNTFTKSKLDYDIGNMKLQKSKPINVFNKWIDVEMNDEDNDNCVKRYLKKTLKKIGTKTIDALGDETGVSSNEIIEFCNKYGIGVRIFTDSGKLEISIESTTKNYPTLVFLIYNNHLYPMTSKYLKRKTHEGATVVLVKNIKNRLASFMDNNILPGDIKMNGIKLTSYVVDNVKYLNNKEYDECKKILDVYALGDKIYDSIKTNCLFSIIERLYVKEDIRSFWPCSSVYTKGGFNYSTDEKVNEEEISTLDKKKCYSQALRILKFLIQVDYRTSKITKKPTEIVPHNLYIADPKDSTILLPNIEVYDGEYLIYCKKEGLEFDLIEEMECTKKPNYYSKMIIDLYNNIDEKAAKMMIVIAIGKMEQDEQKYSKTIVDGIYNKEEVSSKSCFREKLNDDYDICFDTKQEIGTIYNMKPIAIQIKNRSRRMVYEKMKELNLKDEDIVQIKTDSISWKGQLPEEINDDVLEGWKVEKFKKLKSKEHIIMKNSAISFHDIKIEQEGGELILGYAGCGKTKYIIDTLLPRIIKNTQEGLTPEKAIVLTPSHKALEQYRKKGIACDVIQKYTLRHTIPEEPIIIIDEIGMCDKDAHDLIFKCILLEKSIYAFGDFNQLPPVNTGNDNKKFNSEQYLKLIFGRRATMKHNYRNDFTKEYYNTLIEEKVNLQDEVTKYSTKKYSDAEVIICWRNEIVDKYNKLMMEKLGLKRFSPGLKLVCINNKLFKKNIYNKYSTEIESVNGDEVKLTTGETLSKEEIKKNFKPAYAITLYGIQGQSIESYYYAPEDYFFINGCRAYTIISRIKTK